MRELSLILFFAVAFVGCGEGSGDNSRSLSQNIDASCRDWCANEPAGPSCHQGSFESAQPCYEACLNDYQAEAERECADEWIAIKDCQIELDCEDLFGDCDSAENAFDECVRVAIDREVNREYCLANCPDLDITVCQQDTAECEQLASNRAYCQANCPSLDIEMCQQDTAECEQLASNRAYCQANCPSLDIEMCQQDTTACEGPRFDADCSAGPLEAPIANCQPEPLPSTGDPYADCVTRINQLRWECQCLPLLRRWSDGENCADQHAEYDSTRSTHSGFRDDICTPRGWAQNECPGWPSEDGVITGCLQAMWDEGPGEPFSAHGHYINMTNPEYSMVACGFYETADGQFWSVQNFQ